MFGRRERWKCQHRSMTRAVRSLSLDPSRRQSIGKTTERPAVVGDRDEEARGQPVQRADLAADERHLPAEPHRSDLEVVHVGRGLDGVIAGLVGAVLEDDQRGGSGCGGAITVPWMLGSGSGGGPTRRSPSRIPAASAAMPANARSSGRVRIMSGGTPGGGQRRRAGRIGCRGGLEAAQCSASPLAPGRPAGVAGR